MASRRITLLAWLGLAVGAGCLAMTFLAAGIWPASLLSPFLAALWIISQRSPGRPGLPLLMMAWTLLAGTGFWFGLPGLAYLLPLAGLLGILAAFDLESFSHRLAAAGVAPDQPALEQGHLGRLGLVLGSSAAISAAALLSRFHLSFGAAVLLSLAAILGLVYGLNRLRSLREENP